MLPLLIYVLIAPRRTSSHVFFLSLARSRTSSRTHTLLCFVLFLFRTHARRKEHFFSFFVASFFASSPSSSAAAASLFRTALKSLSLSDALLCCSVAVLVTSISSSSSARCSFHRANFRIASILMAPNRPTLLLGLLVEYIASGGFGYRSALGKLAIAHSHCSYFFFFQHFFFLFFTTPQKVLAQDLLERKEKPKLSQDLHRTHSRGLWH